MVSIAFPRGGVPIPRPRWFRVEWAAQGALLLLVYLSIRVFFYESHQYATAIQYGWQPWKALYRDMALAAVFAVATARVRYDTIEPMLASLTRMLAIGIALSLVLDPPDFLLSEPNGTWAHDFIRYLYVPSLAFCIVSLFRPSFLLLPAAFIIATRYLSQTISGLDVSILDIQYLVDSAAYCSIFCVACALIARLPIDAALQKTLQLCVAMVAVGMHIGNYFWSAIAKMAAGPHLWSWLLDNKTYLTTAYALENRTLPIGAWPHLTQALFTLEKSYAVPLNAFVLGIQLLSIVCIFRVRWLRISTIAYDILHIGIYLCAGLFFWQWVWNNLAVLRSLKGYRSLGWTPVAACLMTILLGYEPLGIVESAALGWFDLANARQTYFTAVTKDGRELRVPTDYFLANGHSVAHGYMDMTEKDGQYPFTWWASGDYDRAVAEHGCSAAPAVAKDKLETPEARAARLASVGNFVRANHARMTALADRWGMWAIYARVHHLPSNPLMFAEFNRLKPDDIAGYNLVVASTCHGIADGRSTARAVATDKVFFDVR